MHIIHAVTPCILAMDWRGTDILDFRLLRWSYKGKWVIIPLHPAYLGHTPRNGRVARVEWYRDEQGVEREAFSYGQNQSQITIWYNMDEFKAILL